MEFLWQLDDATYKLYDKSGAITAVKELPILKVTHPYRNKTPKVTRLFSTSPEVIVQLVYINDQTRCSDSWEQTFIFKYYEKILYK